MGFTLRGAGVAVVLVALAADASAEPTIKLAEVIAVAVRQSPELERARIDVATAQGQLLQAQGIEDTHATASASGQFVRPPAGSVGDSDTLSVVLGVTKPLSTGGTIAIQTRGQ